MFDDDEYAAGDIGVFVTDQAGRSVGAGESVVYRLYPDGAEAPATLVQTTTDENGVAPVDFDTAAPTGEMLLQYRLGSETDPAAGDALSSTTFTAGEAVLTLTPDPGSGVARIGGQIDYVGSLTVDDVPLTGRGVALRYVRGYEVVPGRNADAGIVTDDGAVLNQALTTDGRGLFRATVADRRGEVAASEVGGRLVARTTDNVASEASTLDGNAGSRSPRPTGSATAAAGRWR